MGCGGSGGEGPAGAPALCADRGHAWLAARQQSGLVRLRGACVGVQAGADDGEGADGRGRTGGRWGGPAAKGEEEEEEEDEEVRARRDAVVAQEVRRHLTAILLEVTDQLFGESVLGSGERTRRGSLGRRAASVCTRARAAPRRAAPRRGGGARGAAGRGAAAAAAAAAAGGEAAASACRRATALRALARHWPGVRRRRRRRRRGGRRGGAQRGRGAQRGDAAAGQGAPGARGWW